MNILLLYHPSFPVPPYKGYGGVQRGIYDLALGLAARGHTLHLLTTKDSEISHPHIIKHFIRDYSLMHDYNTIPNPKSVKEAKQRHDAFTSSMQAVNERIKDIVSQLAASKQIDVINLRWEDLELQEFCINTGLPVVVSIHCDLADAFAKTLIKPGGTYTALSETHRKKLGAKNIVNTGYGIDLNLYKFDDEIPPTESIKSLSSTTTYAVHVSGISREKGQKSAIQIAKAIGIPLIIAGKPMSSPATEDTIDYFDKELSPLIDNNSVIYHGSASENEKRSLFKNARVFIFPSGFEKPFHEPYGRVIAESLAYGTPVVAYASGSANELIKDGVNGYLFHNLEEAIAKTRLALALNRQQVFNASKTAIDVNNFIVNTEKLFQRILA